MKRLTILHAAVGLCQGTPLRASVTAIGLLPVSPTG